MKYKNTVVLTYKIEYAHITETECEIGKRNFNYYNKQKALELQQYIIT